MGRVLLAALPDDELEERLARIDVRRLTSHTVSDEKALRAEIARVRAQGYAVVDQELEPGLRSVAAPIRGRDQAVVAAVNVSTSTGRRDPGEDPIPDIVPSLLTTAQRISADLSVAGN
jgi:IclR family pca regulon transcriptional regulator